MKSLFLISANWTAQRTEAQYLLMVALLNFDFSVTVVFNEGAWSVWQNNPHLKKHLTALQLYGVETFYLLNTEPIHTSLSTTLIDHADFLPLKEAADIIL